MVEQRSLKSHYAGSSPVTPTKITMEHAVQMNRDDLQYMANTLQNTLELSNHISLNGHQYERIKCARRNIAALIDETEWDENGQSLSTIIPFVRSDQ